MNEPIRWRDDPDAPSELREVLSRAKPSRRMTAEQFARGSRRLAAGAAAAGGTFLWLKGTAWAAVIGVGGGIVLVTSLAVRSPDKPTEPMQESIGKLAGRSEHRAPPPRAVPPESEVLVPEDLPPDVTPTPAKSPAVADSTASSPRDSLAEETELIEQARRLVASDPNRALSVLDQHQKRFARGKLGMERELLRVDALRRAGRTAEARSLVDALLARAGNSIYEARLRKLQAALGG